MGIRGITLDSQVSGLHNWVDSGDLLSDREGRKKTKLGGIKSLILGASLVA